MGDTAGRGGLTVKSSDDTGITEGVKGEIVVARERFIYESIAGSIGVDEAAYCNSGLG